MKPIQPNNKITNISSKFFKTLNTENVQIENLTSDHKKNQLIKTKIDSTFRPKSGKENHRSISNNNKRSNKGDVEMEKIKGTVFRPRDYVKQAFEDNLFVSHKKPIQSSVPEDNQPVKKGSFNYQSLPLNNKSLFDTNSKVVQKPNEKGNNENNSQKLLDNHHKINDIAKRTNLNKIDEICIGKFVNRKYHVNKFCPNHPEKKVKFFVPCSHFLKNNSNICQAYCSKCAVNLIKERVPLEEIIEETENKCDCEKCQKSVNNVEKGQISGTNDRFYCETDNFLRQKAIDRFQMLLKNEEDCQFIIKELKQTISSMNDFHKNEIDKCESFFNDLFSFLENKKEDVRSKMILNHNQQISTLTSLLKKTDHFSNTFSNFRMNFDYQIKDAAHFKIDTENLRKVINLYTKEVLFAENGKFSEIVFSKNDVFIEHLKNMFNGKFEGNMSCVFKLHFGMKKDDESKKNATPQRISTIESERKAPKIHRSNTLYFEEDCIDTKNKNALDQKRANLTISFDKNNLNLFSQYNEKCKQNLDSKRTKLEIEGHLQQNRMNYLSTKSGVLQENYESMKNTQNGIFKKSEENLMDSDVFFSIIDKKNDFNSQQTPELTQKLESTPSQSVNEESENTNMAILKKMNSKKCRKILFAES